MCVGERCEGRRNGHKVKNKKCKANQPTSCPSNAASRPGRGVCASGNLVLVSWLVDDLPRGPFHLRQQPLPIRSSDDRRRLLGSGQWKWLHQPAFTRTTFLHEDHLTHLHLAGAAPARQRQTKKTNRESPVINIHCQALRGCVGAEAEAETEADVWVDSQIGRCRRRSSWG